MEWADEYQKLVNMNNTPRVVIDNVVCSTATLVHVDSPQKNRILLEAVQALTDLNLSINKAYISFDGRWFMDVFHVTDHQDRKLKDDSVIAYIEQSIGTHDTSQSHTPSKADNLTALELTGTDRPGLLSEVFAVLADHNCSIVESKVWTHNGRMASLIFLKDEDTGSPIQDGDRIQSIEARLRNVVKGDGHARGATTTVPSTSVSDADRRLHQMMFADRDYERACSSSPSCPSVSVQNWVERGYSVVNVQCKERPKLLFDIICTLTDMEYVVFHGTIDTDGELAHQEFYIRHSDGSPISSEAERQRVILCLQAAIERRASEGLRLDLRTVDRRGLLADVTRTFRENGLSVTRAEVSTKDGMAVNTFYVTDAAGEPADAKTIEAVIERVGADCLVVKDQSPWRVLEKRAARRDVAGVGGAGLFYLGSFVKRNLYNLGLIRSCS